MTESEISGVGLSFQKEVGAVGDNVVKQSSFVNILFLLLITIKVSPRFISILLGLPLT